MTVIRCAEGFVPVSARWSFCGPTHSLYLTTQLVISYGFAVYMRFCDNKMCIVMVLSLKSAITTRRFL